MEWKFQERADQVQEERFFDAHEGLALSVALGAAKQDCHMDDPRTLREALDSPERDQWLAAMQEEFDSLQRNGTWRLVDKPPGRKIVGTRWLFKTKRGARGEVVRYKARLVAQGFAQVPGVDFFDTYAPVVKLSSLRVLLSLGAVRGWPIEQTDVSTAFLNAPLREEVYARQPPSFERGDGVCLLLKGLYGLRQAPKEWNDTIHSWLSGDGGLVRADKDPCLYVAMEAGETVFVLALYVDDMIYTGRPAVVERFKAALGGAFRVVHEGEASFFLGMEIARSLEDSTVVVRQRQYVRDLVRRAGMEGAKPAPTPLAVGADLTQVSEPTLEDLTTYKSIVGSLLYLSTCTRVDIAAAVGVLSRFMDKATPRHLTAAKRVIRYLKGTEDLGLRLGGGLVLQGYADSDWAGDKATRCSTSGYAFLLGAGCVSWRSVLQRAVARSSAEAELMALDLASREATWLRSILAAVGVPQEEPTVLHEDNQATIAMLTKPGGQSDKSKHIDIRFFAVKQDLGRSLQLRYCPSNKQLADFLTKALEVSKFQQQRDKVLTSSS